MSANDYNGDLTASRKLTDEETSELRGILVKDLKYSPDEQEDVDDLLDYTFAMVSNGKSLSYVVQELVSMEMDVCKEPQAHGIAIQISKFLEENVNQVQAPVQDDDDDDDKQHRVVALKSSESEGNALTMSGALGASRERGKKDEGRRQQSRGDRRDNNRQSGRQGNDRHGRGRGRMNASEAFERLSGNRNDRRGGGGGRDDRKSDPGRSGRGGGRGDMRRGGRDLGRGGRGDMGRGGRGDMGRGGRGDTGRGGRGDTGRGGGRGSPNQRGGRGGGRNAPMSGTRRSRDETRGEEDFIPAGRGGRVVGRVGGRVDGRDGGRGGRYEEGNKRQRTDDWGHQAGYSDNYYDESWGGYDEGNNDYNWRGGGYRGGRGGRGRGRGRGGRGGRGDESHGDGEGDGEGAEGDTDAVSQAAASHPSPIVAASFGRGYRGRGRGRGRGGRFDYRAQVASMIASKSWVRPKAEDEGGNKGGSDSKQNGDGATDVSEG